MNDSSKAFLLEKSKDGIEWSTVLTDGHSWWTIRQARDLSESDKEGFYYRVTNTEMNAVLITIRKGHFVYDLEKRIANKTVLDVDEVGC